jgi:hypothetical protein
MYYKLIKAYTHHGGKTVKLSTIEPNTLIIRDKVLEDNPGLEYMTLSFGSEPQYYLSAEVVESSSEFFQELTPEEFSREIGARELVNLVLLNQERGISPEESAQILMEHFDLVIDIDFEDEEEAEEEELDQPANRETEGIFDENGILKDTEAIEEMIEEFDRLMKQLKEGKENPFNRPNTTWPYQPYTPPQPNHYNGPTCHCGNDGTKPCYSTACPSRIVVTYTTNSNQ